MEFSPILKNTALCAIVRDEEKNPAGGIKRFVDSHVPYIEEAVIVDTGSKDRTREILEELEGQHPNLSVDDLRFEGFAQARNFSLNHSNATWALILDADELLTQEDLFEIEKEKSWKENFYSLRFKHLLPNGEENVCVNSQHIRFFNRDKARFKRKLWEELWEVNSDTYVSPDNAKKLFVTIKHFLPSRRESLLKENHWYSGNFDLIIREGIAPSQTKGFESWKQYNPQRDLYD